jgi:hypothetical protein
MEKMTSDEKAQLRLHCEIYKQAWIYRLQSEDKSLNFYGYSKDFKATVREHRNKSNKTNPITKTPGYTIKSIAKYTNIRKDDLLNILSHFIQDYPNINPHSFKNETKKLRENKFIRCKECFECYSCKEIDYIHFRTNHHKYMIQFKQRLSIVLQQLKNKFAPKKKLVLKKCVPAVIQQPIHNRTTNIDFVYAF